jgi:hypothetical protein
MENATKWAFFFVLINLGGKMAPQENAEEDNLAIYFSTTATLMKINIFESSRS